MNPMQSEAMANAVAAKPKKPRPKRPEPLRLIAKLDRVDRGYSLGVRWHSQQTEPWTESFAIEGVGTLIRPSPTPKQLRAKVVIRIYASRTLSPRPAEPIEFAGLCQVYPDQMEVSAFVPLDSFTALLAMLPLEYLRMTIQPPRNRLAEVMSFALDSYPPDDD